MKKFNLIFVLTITLLALLSSNVLAGSEIDELGLKVNIVCDKDDLPRYEWKDKNGNVVDAFTIYNAAKKDILSQKIGSTESDIESIMVRLEYATGGGQYANIITNLPNIGPASTDLSGKMYITQMYLNTYTPCEYQLYLEGKLGGSVDDFPYHNYVKAKNHSLYASIYVKFKNDVYPTKVEVIPIQNGVDEGDYSVEAFQILRDSYGDCKICGELDCVSDSFGVLGGLEGYGYVWENFNNNAVVQADYIMHLDFSSENIKKIEKTNGKYPQSLSGEIIFDVNKSGTYLIIAKYKGKEKEDFPLFTVKYKPPYAGDPGFYYGCVDRELQARMANAGKSDGTSTICPDFSCEGLDYEEGIFLKSNPNRSYPLKAGELYAINVTNFNDRTAHDSFIDNWEFEIHYLNDELIQIVDHASRDKIVQDGVKQLHINGRAEVTLFTFFEKLLSYPVRNVANGLILMTNWQLGYIDEETPQMTVSVDTIVFDNYPLTKLSLFTGDVKPDDSKNFVNDFVDVINTWYTNFTLIAIVAYLAILLYMGIRIVLNSTATSKAMYKELFTHWVAGVLILFTFPIVIRYAIKINTAFVDIIEKTITDKVDESVVTGEYEAPDDSSEISSEENLSKEAKDIIKNPFEEDDNGYMAVMARRAHKTERLSYAFVYLIMAFQLIIIAVMYYKRLFMVVFLLVLFPLVMIAHLLEKVADIKTGGAFGKWTKEILINIFVQSIHAIIYSFAISTVMQAGSVDGTNAQNDWILMIVGVTFLFNGEEILKKILGQSSESAPSLGKTAAKTVAVATAVTAGGKRIADNFVGPNSHLGKSIANAREAKVLEKKAELVDVIGEKPKQYKMPPATELEHFKPEYTEFGDTQALEIGNAIQVMNHIEIATPDQISHAMNVIEHAKGSGKYNELLKDMKISDKQFAALQEARDNVAADAISGKKTKQQIDMELTMTVEQVLPDVNPQVLKAAIYTQVGSPLMRARIKDKDTSKVGIKREIEDARERFTNLKNKIRIADDKNKPDGDADKKLAENAAKLLQDTYGIDKTFTRDQYRMALSVSMIKDAQSGKYDAKELLTSANFAFRHQNDSKEFIRMAAAADCDIEDFRHVLAEKVARKAYSENYRTASDKKAAKQFSGKAGSRLDDARKMADKILDEYEGENAEPEEDSQKVTVSQIMKQEFKNEQLSDPNDRQRQNEIFEYEIQQERQKTNTDKKAILSDFAAEMIDATDVYKTKVEGMTKEDMQEMAKIRRSESRREREKAVLTTAYAGLAAPIGAGLGIGLGDENGVITEAIAGGLGASVAADAAVEGVMGEHIKRKVRMRNPYTGEMEEIEVSMIGARSDAGLTLTSSEISAELSNKIKEQFLQNKIKQDRHYEDLKEHKLQQEKAQKRLEETYKRLLGGNNNNNNNTNT